MRHLDNDNGKKIYCQEHVELDVGSAWLLALCDF